MLMEEIQNDFGQAPSLLGPHFLHLENGRGSDKVGTRGWVINYLVHWFDG